MPNRRIEAEADRLARERTKQLGKSAETGRKRSLEDMGRRVAAFQADVRREAEEALLHLAKARYPGVHEITIGSVRRVLWWSRLSSERKGGWHIGGYWRKHDGVRQRIKFHLISDGRIVVGGSEWNLGLDQVHPDINVISQESFLRQVLGGLRVLRRGLEPPAAAVAGTDVSALDAGVSTAETVESHDIGVVTDASFDTEVLQAGRPVLVHFRSSGSGLPPIVLTTVAKQVATRVQIVELNVDEHPDAGRTYGAGQIPRLTLFLGGQPVEELERSEGGMMTTNLTSMTAKELQRLVEETVPEFPRSP